MMFRVIAAFAAVAGIGLFLSTSQAAKIKVWQQQSKSQFDKAKFQDAVVTSEGHIRLARQLRTFGQVDVAHVWCVAEDKAGNVYFGTGDEGKIFKRSANGTIDLVYASADSMILSMTAAPDGTIFAGTGPGGQIIRIGADGAALVLADNLDHYVWALVHDGTHLFAATGPQGRIYKVTAEGKSSVFFTSKQEHILCLAAGPDRSLYAGTDKGGLIYRVDAMSKGFIVYQASQPEIHTLLVTADAIYAGTSAATERRSSKTSRTETKLSDSSSSSDGKSGSTTSPVLAPANNENSVYRIAFDGTAREIFREKALVLSLASENGKILIGTGMNGQLFQVDEATKERLEIARLDQNQIHALLKRSDGSVVVATGDTGRLFVLEPTYVAKGTLLSEVLDAKIASKWGALTWRADTPAGTHASFAVRSGNVAEPDETWSDWSAEEYDSARAKAVAPVARFAQYRATLISKKPGATPELYEIALRYQTTNLAPELTSLEVPNLDTANIESMHKLKIKWSASDPNDDDLTYNLYVKKEDWKDWILLEENLERKDYDWDATTVPSGYYRIRVVASDRKDNPAEEALTAQKVSAVIPIAHVPPAVTVKLAKMEADVAVIEASATAPMVRITEASYALDGKTWTNVFPTDGLFDSKEEQFRFKTDSLRPGVHVLVLRVKDAAGNVGAGDVMINVAK